MRSTMTLARMNVLDETVLAMAPRQTHSIELAVVSVDEPQSPT